MKDEVLRILLREGNFVSGRMIGERLGISRAAVWKAVQGLKKEGYEIEAITNRGYLLSRPEEREESDLLNKAEISALLQEEIRFPESERLSAEEMENLRTVLGDLKVFFREKMDSTNARAKELAEREEESSPVLVLALEQSAGRGRRGRSWISDQRGIWMSLLLRPAIPTSNAASLTLLAALSAAKAVREGGAEALIKWPNDLVIEGKKLCGILTEMSADMDGLRYLVCGIGLNVNQDAFPKEIAEHTISLKMHTKEEWIRKHLILSVLKYFFLYYRRFTEKGNIAFMKEEYESLLINQGREVRVLDPAGEYEARALGINELGELIVEREGGEKICVMSGEVSVRGVYGYT